MGDPWLASLLEGLALDVRPFLVDRKRVALEVLLQAGRFERPVARLDTRALFLGDIDLPRYRGVLLSASGTTSVGEPLALSVANADGERYAVRLTPRMLDLPESEDRGRRLVHRLDAGFLIAPRTVLGFSRIRDPYFNPPAHVLPAADWMDPVADRALLWDHIDRVLPRAEMRLLPEGDVCLVANEDTVAEVGRTFDAWASDAARTVRVEITARAGDEVIGRVDVPVLTGRTAFFRLGEDQTVLSDADVEVG